MSPFQKIDCHSHFVPPGYRKALEETGHNPPDGLPSSVGIPHWTTESHLEMHETVNVVHSMLSITSPGTHLTPGEDEAARQLSRYCNEYAADLKRRMPKVFGSFASLPLPDVEGALAEIKFSFEDLNADGVAVLTNHHGVYLGDKRFDPVFDELNRRQAIVFIHPTSPCMLHASHGETNPTLAHPLPQFGRNMFEFFFDTARAIMNLFLSGTVTRCPNITFIVPHLGGALPPLINRFAAIPGLLGLEDVDPNVTPAYVKSKLNSEQFYFDTAGWAFPEQITGLLQYLRNDDDDDDDDNDNTASPRNPAERFLYGSDFPFTPLRGVKKLSDDHDQYLPKVFPDETDQKKLCMENALRLKTKTSRSAVEKGESASE